MTFPPYGITADIIREMMSPYPLRADLLATTFTALSPPPRGASTPGGMPASAG